MSRYDYCAEADDRLLLLRSDFMGGHLSEEVAAETLRELVGSRRTNTDWDALAKAHPCPKGRDGALWMIERFGEAHPPGHPSLRLYGSQMTHAGLDRDTQNNAPPCGCVFCECVRELGVLQGYRDLIKREAVEAQAMQATR